ncbi:MAG: hypothetical protein M3R41_03415 [Pseudomonadota bacterium]|nr:hypothetical protein [Pseudomonadota bacterium]
MLRFLADLSFQRFDRGGQRCDTAVGLGEHVREHWLLERGIAVRKRLVEIAQPCFSLRLQQAGLGQIARAPLVGFGRRFQHLGEQQLETLGLEDLPFQRAEDDTVEPFLPHMRTVATSCTCADLRVAAVIGVAPALSSPDRHPFAAQAATGDLGQQRRAIGDARRRHGRAASGA